MIQETFFSYKKFFFKMLCDTMPASNFVSFISVKQETWAVISRGFYQRIRCFAVKFWRFLSAI